MHRIDVNMLNKNAVLPRPRPKATSKPKTKEQRAQDKLKRDKRSARMQLNMAQKKLLKLEKQGFVQNVTYVQINALEE